MDLSDFYDRKWFLDTILEWLESTYYFSKWERLERKFGDFVSIENVKEVIKDFLLEFD